MHHLLAVIAQATDTTVAASEKKDSNPLGAIAGIAPLILIGAAMYFLLIRPQRRRMRDQQSLMSQIEEGDEVITNGGIYGFVTAIDGDVLWVDIGGDDKSTMEIRIHRSAIARKIDPTKEPAGGTPIDADAADADDATDADDDNASKN